MPANGPDLIRAEASKIHRRARVLEQIADALSEKDRVMIQTVHGTIYEVRFQPAEDEHCDDILICDTGDLYLAWEPSGRSYKNPLLDIEELIG